MSRRKSRHLKLVAAVAVVLVAISGFSGPARKGGGHRSIGKSGGCSSSSSSSHNSGVRSDDHYGSDTDTDNGSGTGTPGTTGSRHGSTGNGAAYGTVTRCAPQSGSEAKAEVEVRNPKSRTRTYTVKVEFLDSAGTYVDSGSAEVRVRGRDSAPVDVRMAHPRRIGDVSDCRVESVS
ncbi:hypothetical protein HCC61_16535 [Streptomyces sp. HNM0575]|uniref:hypothetical protein n=1 Tax=Streptomyces sp. HNM0575 TaxID=2716338 RepID=UPI00145D1250|nr:hypothetical protein [Streptomyces sp. HNM0575]NLU74268.1 hypothetical protein [Streptomyces sp. HNM0575]